MINTKGHNGIYQSPKPISKQHSIADVLWRGSFPILTEDYINIEMYPM